MLDDLGKTVNPFFFRQRSQQTVVIQQKFRLPDRPNQVLINPCVDPILTPDGRIHHRKDRTWDKTERQAPHIDSSYKTREVRHHSPSHTDQPGLAVCPKSDKLFNNGIDRLLYLVLLSRIDDNSIPAPKFFLLS